MSAMFVRDEIDDTLRHYDRRGHEWSLERVGDNNWMLFVSCELYTMFRAATEADAVAAAEHIVKNN